MLINGIGIGFIFLNILFSIELKIRSYLMRTGLSPICLLLFSRELLSYENFLNCISSMTSKSPHISLSFPRCDSAQSAMSAPNWLPLAENGPKTHFKHSISWPAGGALASVSQVTVLSVGHA